MAYLVMVGKLAVDTLMAAASVTTVSANQPSILATSVSGANSSLSGHSLVLGHSSVSGHSSLEELIPSSQGNINNFTDDKIVNGIMYFILGLFLLYAEIYMYRIYSLSCVLPL